MDKNCEVNVKINTEQVKKIIQTACKEPLEHVMEITQAKDSARTKLMAINFYCKKTLEVINKTIEEKL